jgi:glycosyltransferase involved in cell wall biosynthesis
MKVSGFTFVRNAIKFDYPIVESIKSILPICDEVIVAVGKSDDDTIGLIRSIGDPKIKIIETVWDDTLREGGRVLADETNKALAAVSPDSTWCIYVQADEVFHENDVPLIREAMDKYQFNNRVEGLVFEHINFYGTYDYIASNRNWQKREVRVIRNDKSIISWKDAMSFRKNGQKLNCIYVPATIYHYGWVKNPKTQQEKREAFEKLWHDDKYVKEHISVDEVFDYNKIDSLETFLGSHPAVMKQRIAAVNWKLDIDPLTMVHKVPLRYKIANMLENLLGIEIGKFKNYKLLQ